MKVQMTYNGKTVEVEAADEQFEKLFVEEKKKTGYEREENNKFYWFMDSGLEEVGVYLYTICFDPQDNKILQAIG